MTCKNCGGLFYELLRTLQVLFNILIYFLLGSGNRELCNTFQMPLNIKMMLFQGLLPQMKLLKKMFHTILDTKNAEKVEKKKYETKKIQVVPKIE